MPRSPLHQPMLDWYAEHARSLPWREAGVGPWAVLVSEVMLQQTPVVRVLPAYSAWLARWPTPADLAADSPGEAVRQWGRLGYPRRALRLHEAATAIAQRHDGTVPTSYDDLLALPGVGSYTAAAVASFAFAQPHAVVDTNVRRVLARAIGGESLPARTLTAAETRRAESLVPDNGTAARWAVAVMELGALVCTARAPGCEVCPIARLCAWRIGGHRPYEGPPRRGQSYAGTDRQARGRLLAVLRDSEGSVAGIELDAVWPQAAQRARALDGLIADGLVEPVEGDRYRLPTATRVDV
jgi:A/G-specific adenine glycosylase